MDDHDQALAWAQANPQDPRAQDVMAKAWASKNPDDPRSAQIMQRFGASPDPNKAPASATFPMRGAATQDIKDVEAMDPQMRDAFARGGAKAALGLGVGGLAAGEAAGAGMLSRAGISGGAAGLQKYLSNLIDNKDDPTEGVPANTAAGGAISLGADAISSGAGKLADYLMQKAAGMRKYVPGVGNRLVDQGLVGTRGMLENQVESRLPSAEGAVKAAVDRIEGNVDAEPIADAIAREGNKFTLPSTGDVAPGMDNYADKVKAASDEFRSQGEGGELTPRDLLAIKRQGDWIGYTNSGNPASSLESDLGRAQADKARELLNDLSGGQTKDALADEQALILAKKALTRPESIHQGMGSSMFFGKYPGQSLFGSTGAQALQKGVAAPASVVADPEVLQTMFGLKNTAGQ